jgi:hypothetical protein
MPAYIRRHVAEAPFMICPSCVGRAMSVKDVAPRWNVSKVELTYECSDCGAEITHSVSRLELLN